MELTLTGGSTLSDRSPTPVHVNGANGNGSQTAAALSPSGSSLSQSHHHGHSHGHHHNHGHHGHSSHGQCCGPSTPRAPVKINASTILHSKELVQRFKSDRNFRLNVLSNVVRGGPYELFVDLIAVLVTDTDDDESKKTDDADKAASNEAALREADPAELAQNLDGHGADGHTLAHWCAKRGDEPKFLGFLIEKSYVQNGAQLLLDLHIPSKDSVGMYPLHWAVTEGAIPLVSMLLKHLEDRPSPSQRVSSASSSSLMQDDGDLASDSASINPSNVGIDAQDASGCTPLLIASQYGHPDLAAFLIRRGANPHAVDSSRDTALHWAAYKGSSEVCGMLLHLMGVEGHLDAQDAFGQTPLHLASLRGNAETVMFLMEEAGSIGERPGNLEPVAVGRVGSKTNRSSRTSFFYPGKLLGMRDKEEKTPRDLAIKKKKLGCEMLLQEYEEKYLLPQRSLLSRIGRTCRDLFSPRSWKAWMGMGGEIPIGDSLTFPFYWLTSQMLIGAAVYATQFVGLGGKRYDSLLLDQIGLHLFFVVTAVATWFNLYCVYRTNPGVLDARSGSDNSSSSPASCQLVCCGKGGYPRDRISMEMEAVTSELRRQYDEIIESYSENFPTEEKRVPLCHTCRIVKPLRSKHCRVARRCVLMFDHHCPFVGTTIGLYNYIYFYLFLVFFTLMNSGFVAAWIMFMVRSKEFPKGIFVLGGYFAMYLLPVGFMALYHTGLVLGNMTTNEQHNTRRYRYFWNESGRFHNPFNQGMVRNILQRCWPDRTSYELVRPRTSGEVELASRDDEERQPMLSNVV